MQGIGVTRLLICCAMSLGLSGCAGMRIYDSERDTQGQAARKAWSEVNLQASIDGERANLNKLLAAELDTQQTLASAIRDHELRFIVRAPSVATGLVARIDEKLGNLGATVKSVEDARPKQAQWRASQRTILEIENFFTSKQIAAPTCASVAAGATPEYLQNWRAKQDQRTRDDTDTSLEALREECLVSQPDVSGFGKAIGVAQAEYSANLAKLKKEKFELKGLEDAYVQARTEYREAVAAATPGEQLSAKVNAAAAKLKAAVEKLETSSSPYAARLLAEERLKAIYALAQTITEAQPGKPLPENASRTAVALIVLPRLVDEIQTAFAEAKKPLALPLLIRQNHEQLNLEAARRDIAASERIVSLSQELVQALFQQANQLVIARSQLFQKDVEPLLPLSFQDALNRGGQRQREALFRAAAQYLDVVDRLDAQSYQLRYKRVAAHHEKALAYAEVNAKQWESLIGTAVNQVADYSATGFKPEQIANFLNTIGLFYIGAGVNK